MMENGKDVPMAAEGLMGLAPTGGGSIIFTAVGSSHDATIISFAESDEDDEYDSSCGGSNNSDLYAMEAIITRREAESSHVVVTTPNIVSHPSSPRTEISNIVEVPLSLDSNNGLCDSSVGSGSVQMQHTEGPYYSGSCLLSLPEDEENLSPLHCFMRKHCVEVFTGKEDYSVGIQCQHCKHRQAGRAERAVCFPSSLKNIYHSIETWQRRHSAACIDFPAWCKREIAGLMRLSRSGAGGRRSYWEESARRIGLVDTRKGIKFIRPPGTLVEIAKPLVVKQLRPSLPLVHPKDMDLDISGFLYMLVDQMETCYFSEQDRVGGRSKVKTCILGYPGIQCKHCGGKAGFGRYFPLSQTALTSANSDRNILNHLIKCRKCPLHIRDTLVKLMDQQGKNKRGSRQTLFARIWTRMHRAETAQAWSNMHLPKAPR